MVPSQERAESEQAAYLVLLRDLVIIHLLILPSFVPWAFIGCRWTKGFAGACNTKKKLPAHPVPCLCFPRMDVNPSCGQCGHRLEAVSLTAPECLNGGPRALKRTIMGPCPNQCIPCSWLWKLSQDTLQSGLASQAG